MKRIVVYTMVIIGVLSCEKERRTRNPNLGEVHFSYAINLNLPLYNSLKTPMSTVFVPYGGIKGFFVTYNGSSYYAWEAACPNHNLQECHSRLFGIRAVEDENSYEETGHSYTFAKCSCGGTVYDLRTGSPIVIGQIAKPYPLLNYNVSVAGNILTISN
ncbi:hypothetical protein RCZ04_21650 [Capnocytophaga sp. HP1101]